MLSCVNYYSMLLSPGLNLQSRDNCHLELFKPNAYIHCATCPLGQSSINFGALQEIPEEGRRAHRPKRCTDINKDEDNSPRNRNTTNYNQTSSHRFREIVQFSVYRSIFLWRFHCPSRWSHLSCIVLLS